MDTTQGAFDWFVFGPDAATATSTKRFFHTSVVAAAGAAIYEVAARGSVLGMFGGPALVQTQNAKHLGSARSNQQRRISRAEMLATTVGDMS